MATIRFKGQDIHTEGDFPRVGSRAPDFRLTTRELRDVQLGEWHGRRRLLNIFPSIDTPVCALSTRKFDEYAAAHPGAVMLMISADLPFAHERFCRDESLDNVVTLSTLRSDFARSYGVRIKDGPLAGLCARAVIVMDENDTVAHAELVGDIGAEPDYQAALAALG